MSEPRIYVERGDGDGLDQAHVTSDTGWVEGPDGTRERLIYVEPIDVSVGDKLLVDVPAE